MKVLFPLRQREVSGYDNAISRKYIKMIGKSGDIWLIADQENPGDNVYVSGGPGSRGFGGATLKFDLVDGTSIELTGPWHCNSDSLFHDTGHDIRDKYLTYGIVAQKREDGPRGGFEWYYDDIIHQDIEPTIGYYDRIERIAKAWTEKHGKSCYYCFISKGGGSTGSTQVKK